MQSFGNELDYDPASTDLAPQLAHIEQLARDMGAERVLWQRMPNDKHPDRRFRVVRADDIPRTERFGHINHERYDGVVLESPGDSVAVTSRDGPILVLHGSEGWPVAVLHCSRSSLQGAELGASMRSVLDEAFTLCAGGFGDGREVWGVLTMGIAAQHFPNDRYPLIIELLRKNWGNAVIGDAGGRPTIDVAALVKAQLAARGVSPRRIATDALDTFTDTRLASVRAKRGGHNLVIVKRN
jgi:copper oxidase (laccase) domain-containing protein